MYQITNNMSETVKLIRGSIQGIVYLVNPVNGKVYTFNPAKPTYVGTIEVCTDKHMISKSDGALAGYKVKFRDDIREVMERLTKEKHDSSTKLTAVGGAGTA